MADMLNNSMNNNAFKNGSNNWRPFKPFGFNVMNVDIPERTLKQLGDSIKSNTTSGVTNIFNYLERNEKVFDGTVMRQLDNLFVQDFNTKQILKAADKSAGHKFEMDM